MIPVVLLVALVGVVFYIISVYNGLQRLRTQITASIQEIGNQLKRQASLIPNLEASVKGYLKHEKGIYKMITDARKAVEQADKSGDSKDVDKALSSIQAVLPKLQVMVESNPELKANETITKFMDELTDTADKLMYARRTLIDLTQSYNEKLITFPSNLVANIFGFKPEKGLEVATSGSHLEVSATETKDVKVDL